MCGIAGILGSDRADIEPFVAQMSASLKHRGPDAQGIWVDPACSVGLGHTRLSILELSPLGAQPMLSASSRYVVTFNGEIYNYRELRDLLVPRGHRFVGDSDTEVLLAAVEEWGVIEATQRFEGMFAFGIWDSRDRVLSLVRDRIGKKPLYYGWNSGRFLFASELKAIKACPAFKGEIDRESIALQLRHSYIPAPWSIYRGIYKLPPGTCLTLSLESVGERPIGFQPEASSVSGTSGPRAYWSLIDVAQSGSNAEDWDDEDALSELNGALTRAVRLRTVSDVPLGAFLSGGIDSSLVAAVLQRESSRRVQTFSIGFKEASFNEAQYAAQVAAHLGTEHREMVVTPQDAFRLIPSLPTLYDEPFSDSSQIPTHLLSAFARQHVVVALSGDGGDEVFGGYNRYTWARRLSLLRWCIPWPLNQLASCGLRRFSPRAWDSVGAWLSAGSGAAVFDQRFGHRIHRVADFLEASNRVELYRTLISHWDSPNEIVLGAGGEREIIRTSPAWRLRQLDYLRQMMLLDQLTYLPDDILVKVDRASMGVALEARAPLLDHRLVELAWRLPERMHLRGGIKKWALKKLLYRMVPQSLVDRPKMGFGVPLQSWLAGPLREWASDLLSPSLVERHGYLNSQAIQSRWKEFLGGARPWDQLLWDVLMFQSWIVQFENQGEQSLSSANLLQFRRVG